MKPTYRNVHNRFLLNGIHFNYEDLFEVAYSFIKEGEQYQQLIGDFILDWISYDPYISLKTSGSTGSPKFIRFKKQALVKSALATGNHFNLQVGDKALHCLNADFIAGKMMLIRAMILGLEIDLVPPQGNVLSHTTKNYDFVAMVPRQVESSFDSLNRVKTLLIGGAPSTSLLKERLKSTQLNCFETYGMTETLTHIATRNIKEDKRFKLLDGVHISQDKRGCLILKVPYITSQEIVTNDLVELVSAQHFILKGRVDNVINSGGVKIIPEEVEAILSSYIDTPFFIGSVQDPSLGEKLVLVVEGKAAIGLIQTIEGISSLNQFQRPKMVYEMSEFIRTSNGKIKRKDTLATLDL